jgi:hypothetical protein
MRQIAFAAIATVVAVLTILAPEGYAGTTQAPSESLTIRQVSLFKNGLAFFTGHIACPPEATSFQVALPVAPCHGTFWISYPADLAVTGIVARQTHSEQLIDAITIPEILRANPDRRVRLTIGDKEVTGVIRYMARDRVPAEHDPDMSASSLPHDYRPPEQPQQGSLLIVETDAGELTVDPRGITQVTFLDGKAERRFAGGGRSPMLHVQLKKPAAGAQMVVSFLAKGAAWAPSYRVDLTDASTARISAMAMVVNDACEFKDVDTQLVTGFPHLQFADTTSPLALQQNLAQFLHALSVRRAEPRGIDVTSNIMTQSVAFHGPQDQSGMPAYGASEMGPAAEDLFLYPAGRLDLGTREVAYVPLFTESVPCKHVYQWDIPDYVSREDIYEFSRRQPGREEEEVWHSIRLTNTTKVPWTTAPGETVQNGVLLGQDTLSYTPCGAENTLRITRAVSVKAEQNEFEKTRQRQAVQMYGSTFDLVTVQGELSIVNFQDKPIDLEITKTLSGEFKTADPQPKTEKLATGIRRMNSLTKVTWNLQLGPGERKAVGYSYDVYVRR